MQAFIDFIFFKVWCQAPDLGDFRFELFDGNEELREVMETFYYDHTQGGDFFYGHVESIYALFAALTLPQIDQLKQWYQANNDIEKACANDIALTLGRYGDVAQFNQELSKQFATFFKGLYSQQLLDLAALRSKIGLIDNHYLNFIQENRIGKCPFCGIADMHGLYHSKREAYDHYLPKSLYPFNTINFKNLVPACHHCNSTYKSSQDPAYTAKDPAQAVTRRKVFYPYAGHSYHIDLKVDLRKSDIEHLTPNDIEIEFGPGGLKEEIETWKDVYGIEERYKAKCCSESDGKYWLTQVLDEWQEDGRLPADYLTTLTRQAQKRPFADSNFLKKAFLDGCDRAGLFKQNSEEI
ncbi:MAG: hypothetical protein KC592_07875 [Nitrospira sp.]|nr:hypothetical protein [Nitrospira sp.]